MLDDLAAVQTVCLAVAGAIAAWHLVAWMSVAVLHTAAATWPRMKLNTALLSLLVVVSLYLSQPMRSQKMLRISRWISGLIVFLAGVAWIQNLHPIALFGSGERWQVPGRITAQSATCFLLLGVVTYAVRMRKRLTAHVIDLLMFILSMTVLVMASGYLFSASHLFGPVTATKTSPQTLMCLILISFVAFGRRAEYGVFSIMLGIGIGSKIARIACPAALVLPFLLELAEAVFIHRGPLGIHYVIAIGTATGAMLALALILVLCWRIDSLERAVRDLSLRDDLTKLYNRRGFYILAEQALLLSQRSRTQFSVLYIDLDNLKKINDTLGHDVGSLFLAEVGELLRMSFRETDVVGRIGGDEFVVSVDADEEGIQLAAQRLEEAAAEQNQMPGRKYPLSFSLGHVTTSVENWAESLDDLLDRADHAMYETKQLKKMLREV